MFAREVELVRVHLRPIRSVEMLAASYGRESFQPSDGEPPATAPAPVARSAVEVAYAVRRWELEDEESLPAWPALVG